MSRPPSFDPTTEPAADDWDEARAAELIGKYALVGVAWADGSGERAEQYHGRIVSADRDAGIAIACEGHWAGETFMLPPATSCVVPASPGEYRLRTTGETVISPDVVTTWRIDRGARQDG